MAAPEKLSIIVFSGDYDRVHYALTLASAAAAIDTAVTLFFTMEGARALLPPGRAGAPNWAAREAENTARGVATIEEMLAACVELGAAFMVCEVGLRGAGIATADLRPDVPCAEGGVVTFLNDCARHGQMLFV
jgi:peroxiredoxin family protein